MKKRKAIAFMLNVLFPCLFLSGIVGIITGTLVFFFRLAAHYLCQQSSKIYIFVANHSAYIPLLFLGLFFLSILSYWIVKLCRCIKGGGIPTAVGILRGFIPIHWFRNLIGTILSAFIVYFSGLSMGEEGQCVQLGTCIGGGVAELTKEKKKAWNRYIMTGGASSGFAIATNAPVSGIFFVLEEAHKRFSPMILMVALSSTIFASITTIGLSTLTGLTVSTIELSIASIIMPMQYLWIPLCIGLVVGFFSFWVTKLFRWIHKLWNEMLIHFPSWLKYSFAFLLMGVVGICIPSAVGDGLNLINKISTREFCLGTIALLLCIKTIMALFINNTGVTEGMFVPALCQGSLLGCLLAELFVSFGFDEHYYLVVVVLTIVSYLASVQRVPITAIIFSIEVFGCLNNILHVLIAIFISFMIIEMFNLVSINDIALDQRLEYENAGRKIIFQEKMITVQPNSFAIGKMVRDIFWPADCQILSIICNKKSTATKDGDKHIKEGDVLQVRYRKFADDLDETEDILKSILGGE